MSFPRPPSFQTQLDDPVEDAPERNIDPSLLLRRIFLMLLFSAATAVVILIYVPVDLTAVRAYRAPGVAPLDQAPKPLSEQMRRATMEKKEFITVSEGDLNVYLNGIFAGQQKGLLGGAASFRGLYVDVREKECEVFIERMFLKRRFTVSVILGEPVRVGDQLKFSFKGGRLGSLPVKPGFLGSVTSSLKGLVEGAAKEELESLKKMKEIHFNADQILMDPRFP